ncbi:MAG: Stp1/IreP family PP2C-type Ser/Thr phosphatase [Deltaproteobacteria bacterium]|nr:MAG: Stp1/IreP family PP2C-type Ser/Thr phosphatase [Deltaproteobacteria bacterium]
MKVISDGMTHIGMVRTRNEDHFIVNDELSLYIVADGMGGHVGGEEASRIAIETVEQVITRLKNNPDDTLPYTYEEKIAPPARALKYSVRLASDKIYQKARQSPEYRGMGTTVTALWLEGGGAHIAHVGDCRGYLLRDGKIEQLTEDHSWVQEQVNAGNISAEEAKNHRLRNVITRSVGFEEDVEIDTYSGDLRAGDIHLLCSDGLSSLVNEAELNKIARDSEPEEACRQMVDLANERGGTDNITVVIVRVEEL